MATIKKLELKLKSGLLSDLQSDTIFGHFAWRFKDEHGEEKLTEFLKFFVDDEPIFTISDGLLETDDNIYFPKPLMLTPPKFNGGTKQERIINFIKQKESKARKLITLDELNFYLNGQIDEYKKSLEAGAEKDLPKFDYDLRVSVEIDRKTFKSKDGQLFSYNPKYLDKNTTVVIFIKILDGVIWENLNCEEIFKSIFELGFGKKKSSGYGQFEINRFQDFSGFKEPADSNGFITLSHFLPANGDKISEAYYDINVKYGKFGEEKSNAINPFKPPMLLLKPGSCFINEVNKEFYGRAVQNISDYFPGHIHNGIAFSLACKFPLS